MQIKAVMPLMPMVIMPIAAAIRAMKYSPSPQAIPNAAKRNISAAVVMPWMLPAGLFQIIPAPRKPIPVTYYQSGWVYVDGYTTWVIFGYAI